jgi:predicted AAA+ superfamily ATPase
MDDLSFEENETEYKYLKAVIEGGLETRPDNVLIYATSNRRNLIRETWNDTNDVELDKHRSDTLQEKLSLVSRFGVTIPYMRPNKKEYEEIVKSLASRNEGLELSEEELLELANKWSVSHGGMSGRAAQQLMDSIR